MAELDDEVIETLHSEGERLLADDLVEIVERHHDFDEAGVPRGLVDDYLDALEESAAFNTGPLREQFEEHLTSDRSFVDTNSVYEVGDGRVSAYPAEWHERLDGDASLADYVRVMTDSMDETPETAASRGVAKDELFDVAAVIGGMRRGEARGRLKDLRADGVLVADTDQHPRAGVTLAEDADVEKNHLDKPDWRHGSNE